MFKKIILASLVCPFYSSIFACNFYSVHVDEAKIEFLIDKNWKSTLSLTTLIGQIQDCIQHHTHNKSAISLFIGHPLNDEEMEQVLSAVASFCTERNIAINALDLRWNNLTQIPPTVLTNMPQLKFLQLMGNRIAKLPSNSLDSLVNLTHVNLEYNFLDDSLPRNIFESLERLQRIKIGYNYMLSQNSIDNLLLPDGTIIEKDNQCNSMIEHAILPIHWLLRGCRMAPYAYDSENHCPVVTTVNYCPPAQRQQGTPQLQLQWHYSYRETANGFRGGYVGNYTYR